MQANTLGIGYLIRGVGPDVLVQVSIKELKLKKWESKVDTYLDVVAPAIEWGVAQSSDTVGLSRLPGPRAVLNSAVSPY